MDQAGIIESKSEIPADNLPVQQSNLASTFSLWKRALYFAVKRPLSFLVIALLPFIPGFIFVVSVFGTLFGFFHVTQGLADFVAFATTPIARIVISLLSWALYLWSQIALIIILKTTEETIGLFQAYGKALVKLPRYFWVWILGAVIICAGTVLLVIPGIIFAIWFIFSSAIFIVEDIGGLQALLKSKEYTRGYWWAILGRLITFVLLSFVIFLIVNIPVLFWGIKALVFTQFANILLVFLLRVLFATYIFYMYDSLKTIKNNLVFEADKFSKIIFSAIALLGVVLWIIVILPSLKSLAKPEVRNQPGINLQGQVRGEFDRAGLTNEKVEELFYSPQWTYPPDFYRDPSRPAQAIIIHLSTADISKPYNPGKHYTLCAANRAEVVDWFQQGADGGEYEVNTSTENPNNALETEKYYELRSKRPTYLTPAWARIYKCSYVDFSESKFNQISGKSFWSEPGEVWIGTFNQRPITTENVKGLIEYIWFVNHNNRGAGGLDKIFQTSVQDQGDFITYTMYSNNVAGGSGTGDNYCDQMSLLYTVYKVDKNTGKVIVTEKIDTWKGRCGAESSQGKNLFPSNE